MKIEGKQKHQDEGMNVPFHCVSTAFPVPRSFLPAMAIVPSSAAAADDHRQD